MSIEWKDATSYSQGERGKRVPDAWECTVSGVRVWIGSNHRYYPGEWVMHCHRLGIDTRQVGPASALSDEDARHEALKIAAREASRKARDLDEFVAACGEPQE